METQKNKQKQNKTKKPKRNTHKTKDKREKARKKIALPTRPIFLSDFLLVVYLFLHQNLLSTIHLHY